MGAMYHTMPSDSENLAEAFRASVTECLRMNGHGGYSGTLAEKVDVVDLNVVCDTIDDALNVALALRDHVPGTPGEERYIDDKWGPANAIRLLDGGWLLFGWCSS